MKAQFLEIPGKTMKKKGFSEKGKNGGRIPDFGDMYSRQASWSANNATRYGATTIADPIFSGLA